MAMAAAAAATSCSLLCGGVASTRRLEIKCRSGRDRPTPMPGPQTVLRSLLENRALRNAAFGAVNMAMVSLPAALAMASEEKPMEKGKIFDFNLTLPIIAAEFLALMVALDNIWFKPVGKVMDDRDEMIRKMLEGVKDNSDEIKALQDEAEGIIAAARAEVTAELNKMRKETAAELDAKLQKSRERIEQELAAALANLEEQKKETLRTLESQVQSLSDKIVEKVFPVC